VSEAGPARPASPLARLFRGWSPRHWRIAIAVFGLLLGLVLAFAFRNHILLAALDPKQPFQTYRPPPAPDYAQPSAWALGLATPAADAPANLKADVFFIHPTTYNGGEEWNGPIDHPRARRLLEQTMLPNYAGPFARVGRVFAPRYRQASLYAMRTLREDSREARRFAYEDVRQAFRFYLARYNAGRPFILAGAEQGGSIAARLLAEEIARDPAVLQRLAAAYLIETPTPADRYGAGAPIPACAGPAQAHCAVAWLSAPMGDDRLARHLKQRALVWDALGQLEPLGAREPLCINPLLGARTDAPGPQNRNLGAVNATDLEWGLRPAFQPRQVSARCRAGILEVSRPRSSVLKPARGWADRLKLPGFNLFYADLEADALARLKAVGAEPDDRKPAPPITASVEVRRVPVMGR
jgi:hypothetical protein